MRIKLKQIRIYNNYTHQELADILGISRSAYTNIERGLKNPSFRVAVAIKKALKYEADDIFLD